MTSLMWRNSAGRGLRSSTAGFADAQRAVSASHRVRRVRTWTSRTTRRILAVVNEPARDWRLGEQILVTLPEGQVVRCRVVNVLDDGTVPVVPEHEVVIG